MHLPSLLRKTVTGFALAVLAGSAAAQTVVYQTNFASGLDPVWSSGIVSTGSDVGSYLGQFTLGDTTTLTLAGLPAHSQVTLSFDLYLFRTWDGNNTTWGPDYFSFSSNAVGIGGSWTFTNHQPEGQTYPQTTPTEFFGGPLGSSETTYVFRGLGPTGDHGAWTAGHSGSTFSVTFAGPTSQNDELWGIDNVTVTVSPVPAPPAFLMMLAGLGVIGLRRKRDR